MTLDAADVTGLNLTADDVTHITATSDGLATAMDEGTYDGPEIIMTSIGYVEVWIDGITVHNVYYPAC